MRTREQRLCTPEWMLPGWKPLWLGALFFCGFFVSASAQDTPTGNIPRDDAYLGVAGETITLRENLVLQADFAQYSGAEEKFIAKGNVVLKAGGVELRSRFLEYYPAENYLKATQNVLLTVAPYGDLMSEEVVFDLRKNRILSSMMRGLFLGEHKIAFREFAIDVDGSDANILGGTYTACPICTEEEKASGRASILKPVWRLQFGRVIEDADTRNIRLENISFQISGLHIPIFFLPEIRILSPTVERQSGLLFLKGGGGEFGANFGFPYFIAFGEDSNLTLTPYIGTQHAMLGLDAETIFERGRAHVGALYKPQTNDENRLISSNQLARFAVKGEHFYHINEQARWRNEWDIASDPKFNEDYEAFYERATSTQAPSKIRSQLDYFSQDHYGFISAGVSSNLYGAVPITSSYVESRARYHTDILGGIDINFDSFIREEKYSPAHQEVLFNGFSVAENNNANLQTLSVSFNKPTRRFFANGMILTTKTRFSTIYKATDGSTYQSVDRYTKEGVLFGRFVQNEDANLSAGLSNYLEFSLPMVRYQERLRASITPYVGLLHGFRIFGKDTITPREDWFFPNFTSGYANQQAPYTNDIRRETRLLAGINSAYSIIEGYDATFYFGTSRKIAQRKNSPTQSMLDGNMIFGGTKWLLGKGRTLRYQAIFDDEQNTWIANQLGLDMDFANGIRFAANYVSVARDKTLYLDKQDLFTLEGLVRITDDTALKGNWNSNLSSDDDQFYSVGILYEIPCFELEVAWYAEKETDRFEKNGVREDNGILFSFNIFTATTNERHKSLLGI